MKIGLHLGCGPYNPAELHKTFHGPGWRELRLDIDPRVAPDIVASMTVLPVAGQALDAVWSSHGLELLYAHEVALALGEFHRVLKPDGFALITLPDLQKVAELVAADSLEGQCLCLPCRPHRPARHDLRPPRLDRRRQPLHGAPHGLHRENPGHALVRAGFAQARVSRSGFDLWPLATKQGQATASTSLLIARCFRATVFLQFGLAGGPGDEGFGRAEDNIDAGRL